MTPSTSQGGRAILLKHFEPNEKASDMSRETAIFVGGRYGRHRAGELERDASAQTARV